jgi:hypothetical protein
MARSILFQDEIREREWEGERRQAGVSPAGLDLFPASMS